LATSRDALDHATKPHAAVRCAITFDQGLAWFSRCIDARRVGDASRRTRALRAVVIVRVLYETGGSSMRKAARPSRVRHEPGTRPIDRRSG
jgi:hypothetical protein